MKVSGFFLLLGGFLVAAYATALDVVHTNWSMYLPAAIVAAIGVFLIKRATRGEARSEKVLTANLAELEESLDNIVRNLEEMCAGAASDEDVPLREQIDQRLRDDLRRFADARESLVHLFGLQVYADLMSSFATGERYVNRVWSASADGYADEARKFLSRASDQFLDARSQLRASAEAGLAST